MVRGLVLGEHLGGAGEASQLAARAAKIATGVSLRQPAKPTSSCARAVTTWVRMTSVSACLRWKPSKRWAAARGEDGTSCASQANATKTS